MAARRAWIHIHETTKEKSLSSIERWPPGLVEGIGADSFAEATGRAVGGAEAIGTALEEGAA